MDFNFAYISFFKLVHVVATKMEQQFLQTMKFPVLQFPYLTRNAEFSKKRIFQRQSYQISDFFRVLRFSELLGHVFVETQIAKAVVDII